MKSHKKGKDGPWKEGRRGEREEGREGGRYLAILYSSFMLRSTSNSHLTDSTPPVWPGLISLTSPLTFNLAFSMHQA